MKQKCTVVLLSTKDRTDIVFTGGLLKYKVNKGLADVSQHLYITVSQEVEPITEGCWITDGKGVYHNKVQLDGYIGFDKIIATTDIKLREKQYKARRLPKLPQQFIKEYCDKGGIDKVMIEYEEELTAELYLGRKWGDSLGANDPKGRPFYMKSNGITPKVTSDNTLIIHPLEEKIPTPFQQAVLNSLDTEMLAEILAEILAYKEKEDSLKGKITEEHFRNFIRTNHLTAQWDKWIKENL